MNKTFILYIFLSVISSVCYNKLRNISILIDLRWQSEDSQLINSCLYRQVPTHYRSSLTMEAGQTCQNQKRTL